MNSQIFVRSRIPSIRIPLMEVEIAPSLFNQSNKVYLLEVAGLPLPLLRAVLSNIISAVHRPDATWKPSFRIFIFNNIPLLLVRMVVQFLTAKKR